MELFKFKEKKLEVHATKVAKTFDKLLDCAKKQRQQLEIARQNPDQVNLGMSPSKRKFDETVAEFEGAKKILFESAKKNHSDEIKKLSLADKTKADDYLKHCLNKLIAKTAEEHKLPAPKGDTSYYVFNNQQKGR